MRGMIEVKLDITITMLAALVCIRLDSPFPSHIDLLYLALFLQRRLGCMSDEFIERYKW